MRWLVLFLAFAGILELAMDGAVVFGIGKASSHQLDHIAAVVGGAGAAGEGDEGDAGPFAPARPAGGMKVLHIPQPRPRISPAAFARLGPIASLVSFIRAKLSPALRPLRLERPNVLRRASAAS